MKCSLIPSLTVSLLILMGNTGCDDQKKHIAMLEETNQQLLGDLQNAREQILALRQANDTCQGDLTDAAAELDRMRAELAKPQEEAPAGWTPVPGGAMIALEGSMLFDGGKADLRSSSQQTLERIVQTIRANYSDKDILVYGHTDNVPITHSSWKDNYQLSTERALSVVRWLAGRGISPSKLVACGCGENRPVVANTSDENRAKNRRVEIYALEATPVPAS